MSRYDDGGRQTLLCAGPVLAVSSVWARQQAGEWLGRGTMAFLGAGKGGLESTQSMHHLTIAHFELAFLASYLRACLLGDEPLFAAESCLCVDATAC